MHEVFFLARIYPYWAFPLALTFGQLAVHFRRRRHKAQYPLLIAVAVLCLTALAWIVFRGDHNADSWVRWFLSLGST